MILSFPSRSSVRSTAALALALAALSGCADFDWKQMFGMERNSPDEFKVVSHPPLTIPPDYNLRPPQPGAPGPLDTTPHDQAAEAVLGGTTAPASLKPPLTQRATLASSSSASETRLLQGANAGAADPKIRQELQHDASTPVADVSPGMLQSLLFGGNASSGQVLNASAEEARLKQNAAMGAPVNAGETPVIERRAQAPLEGMLP